MAINIIVEDGTIVPGANSYISIADTRIYAENRGVPLPPDDDKVAAWLIRACDYLQGLECRLMGRRSDPDQALSFPRKNLFVRGQKIAPDAIPQNLIDAQCQLVMISNSGIDLQPVMSPQDFVILRKVGPIETQYADPTKVGLRAVFSAVEALLNPLFGACGAWIRTIRV